MYRSWEHRNSKNHKFIIIFREFWRSAAEAAACKLSVLAPTRKVNKPVWAAHTTNCDLCVESADLLERRACENSLSPQSFQSPPSPQSFQSPPPIYHPRPPILLKGFL